MAANLLVNVGQALEGMPVAASYGWLDTSTVALQWPKGGVEYTQFVMNRVKKIHVCPNITCHHDPSRDNPTDLVAVEVWSRLHEKVIKVDYD